MGSVGASLFTLARELLPDTEVLKVFAPTSGWAKNPEKDAWIKAVADTTDIDRYFILGDTDNEENQSIVDSRADIMEQGGVKVKHVSKQLEAEIGFIVFDHSVILGLGTWDGGYWDYILLDTTDDVNTANRWFDGLWEKI